MRKTDKALMRSFRGTACEKCGSRQGVVGHHVRTRSTGRLDLRINTVGLCFVCHTAHHAGKTPTTDECFAIVAEREGLAGEDIRDAIDQIRRPTCTEEAAEAIVLALRSRKNAQHPSGQDGDGLRDPVAGVGPVDRPARAPVGEVREF